MNLDSGDFTESIFKTIVKGRQAERHKAQTTLVDSRIDRCRLRILILDALSQDFYPRADEERDTYWPRMWLLSTLGRISDDDPEANRVVRDHLNPKNEPNAKVRFWSLEGLLVAKASDFGELARDIVEKEPHPLVRMLAVVYLASMGDSQSKEEVERSLSTEESWATVRALKFVPIVSAEIVKALSRRVNEINLTDQNWGIIALGQVPNDSIYAETAARSLEGLITKIRDTAFWDASRTQALKALGNLKVESTAPLFIEELSSDNPAIVREAARGLEKVVGTKIAVARIVEAASRANQDRIEVFANALRWMNRASIVEVLEAIMVSGLQDQQDTALKLLMEIGGITALQKLHARTKSMAKYNEVIEKSEERIRSLFETSIHEARSGFKLATSMDTIVFFLGVGLIAISAWLVLSSGGTLDNWAGVGLTGGTGILGVIYGILIANPRRKVQEAVDHLMSLKVIFLAYIRQLHQNDQAYTHRLLDDKSLTPQEVDEFSERVKMILLNTVEQLRNEKG